MSKQMTPPMQLQSTITDISDKARGILALEKEYWNLTAEIDRHKSQIEVCRVKQKTIEETIRKLVATM